MDGSNWKRVLLHWVNQLRFFERTFYNLEQTDIEEFFTKFREHINTTPVKESDLTLFLKEQYPEFEIHLDDENQISSADYMYAYSLLLHFSCVKCPQEYFHKICKSLHENYQQVIALFFKEILEKDNLNKTNLRQAIADASPKVPLKYISLGSPIKTPRDKCLPPTPKTNMLEEKTKEVNFIKAQLDTERYEKGLLEVQLKQQEEQIEKLTQAQRKYAAEVQELKTELLAKSTENLSPSKNVQDEQIKKRLRKEIAEKEEIIFDLRENIYTLTEEKSLLAEKLSYTETQVITCLEKIKEMDSKIVNLKNQIEEKDASISYLTEVKSDLEQFIEATRSPCGNQSDLNNSVECLDISRTTNSSGSLNSPENLGVSVIDIQLKEKENENAILRKDIDKLKCDQSKLSRHVCDLIVRYADVFEICDQNVVINNKEMLQESFTVFDNYVNRLVDKYKYSMKSVNQLSQETLSLSNVNKELKKKMADMETRLHSFENQIHRIDIEKLELGKENIEIQKKYESCIFDIQKLNDERPCILSTIDTLKKDYQTLKIEKEIAEKNFAEQIKELTSALSSNRTHLDQIEDINLCLKSKICQFLKNMETLEEKAELAATQQKAIEEKNACLAQEKSDLLEKLEKSIQQQKDSEESLKSRLEDMAKFNEKLELENVETKKQLKKLEKELQTKESQLIKLEEATSGLLEENGHFNTQLVDLTATNDSLEKTFLKQQNEITSLHAEMLKKSNECVDLQKQLDAVNNAMKKMIAESENSNALHKKVFEELNNKLKEWEIKMAHLSAEKEDLQKTMERVQNENKLLSDTITDNETYKNELCSIVENLKEEKKTINEHNDRIQKDLHQKVQMLSESSENLKSQLSSLFNKIEEENFENIMHALSEEYSDPLIKKFPKKIIFILKTNQDLIKSNSAFQNKNEQLETRLENVEIVKDKLILKLNNSRQQIELLEKENRDLDEAKCKYMNNVEELTNNLTFLESSYERLSKTNEKLESIITSLEGELQSSCQDNMNLMNKIGELEGSNEVLSGMSKNLTEEIELIKSEMEKLIVKSESAASAIKEQICLLEAEKKLKEDDLMLLQKQCEEKSDKIKVLEVENAELQSKYILLDQTLKEKESHICCLENENDKLKLNAKDLSEQLALLEKNLTQKWQEAIEKSQSLENDLQTLNASKEDLLTDLKKSENSIKEISDELEGCKQKIVELSSANTELENDNKTLFEKLKTIKQLLEDEQLKYESMEATSKKLKEEKLNLEEEFKRSQEETHTLKDKILDMITQVSYMNTEKEESMRRNNDLTKEIRDLKNLYNEKQVEIDVLQDTYKKTVEQITSLRESLLETQKELSFQKSNCKNAQDELKIIKAENAKLIETQSKLEEISTGLNKRLEKVSIKLGDSQACALKLERENEALKKNYESSSENLRKENAKYSLEINTLKDKLSALELSYDKIITEHKFLEEKCKMLEDQNNNLYQSEGNLKKLVEEMEKEKTESVMNVKKISDNLSEMSGALECAKSENIKLDKKSAMLTMEINELKNEIDIFKKKEQIQQEINADLQKDLENKCQELAKNLSHVQDQYTELRQSNDSLEVQLVDVYADTSKHVSEITELNTQLKVLQNKNKLLQNEITNMQSMSEQLRKEKENLEKENQNTLEALRKLEQKQIEVVDNKNSSDANYARRIRELESNLNEKADAFISLATQLEKLKLQQNVQAKEFTQKSEIFQDIKEKLVQTEHLYHEQKTLNEGLQKDISIFKAKLYKNRQMTEEKEKNWLEERNRLIAENKLTEERIKENRLELEGKLEKMKAKMKTIYNEEVSKIKNRHEKEVCALRKEIHALSVKNEKYEAHVQMLSKRAYELNETVLDLQKEIKFMETKLKDYETYSSSYRRPHHQPSSQMLGADLRMEDEEGEVFNNTYLTDLKTGRISPFGRDSVSLHELQYRNSLAPPHLRSTYMAQYADQHLREEDIKENMTVNLDDSLSSLLHAGQKKKLTGTTSYKRPGPPTPSKNAGRLSFGGCIDIHPREILKESNDSSTINRKTTPNKLKNFFTSSKSRDEFASPSNRNLSRRSRKSFPRPLSAQFTSTPRKSKAHYDQRRQLDLLLNSSNSDNTDNDKRSKNIRAIQKLPAETDWEHSRPSEKFNNWRQPNKNFGTESDTSESNTSVTDRKNIIDTSGIKPNPKDRRVSFFYRGNIYARSKVPSKILRDQLKDRVKNQRNSNFNRFRKSLNEIKLRKSLLNNVDHKDEQEEDPLNFAQKELVPVDFPFDNNNNDSHQFEQMLQQKISQAPFEITELNCISSSSGSTMAAMSKTLYAGSVIFNRKLPSVNTTMVRKTSFYIMNKDNRSIIALLPEQKITCRDLFRMWGKMNNVAKSVILLCFLTLLTPILVFLLNVL